jgi:hypothetical protein
MTNPTTVCCHCCHCCCRFLSLQSILQGVDAPLVPNTAVAKLLGATDAPKAASDSKTGRKLMQGGGRGSGGGGGGGSRGRGDRNNIWAAQNTQSAIRAAASGRTPASYASSAGSRNARNAGARCVNCVNWR